MLVFATWPEPSTLTNYNFETGKRAPPSSQLQVLTQPMQGAHLLMLSVCVLVAPAYAHAMTPPAGRAVVHVVRTAAPPLASLVSSSSASPPKQLRRPAAAATALSMEQQQQQQEQEQHEEQEQQPSSSRLDDFLSQFLGKTWKGF